MMEQRYTSDVISLWEKNRIIYLKLGRSFRDAGFDFYFGRIQNALRKSQAVALRVFFDQCEWADPLPMMALATELFLWCSEHDKQSLEIHLPDLNFIPDNQKGFIAFIVQEGFLDVLTGYQRAGDELKTKIFINLKDSTKKYEKYRDQYLSLTPFLVYRNPTCIPFALIDLNQKGIKINQIVDDLILQAEYKGLKKYLPQTSEQNDIVADPTFNSQELRQIIVEILKNIKEHAYDDEAWAMRTWEAKAYVAEKLKISVADLTDSVIMTEVREDL